MPDGLAEVEKLNCCLAQGQAAVRSDALHIRVFERVHGQVLNLLCNVVLLHQGAHVTDTVLDLASAGQVWCCILGVHLSAGLFDLSSCVCMWGLFYRGVVFPGVSSRPLLCFQPLRKTQVPCGRANIIRALVRDSSTRSRFFLVAQAASGCVLQCNHIVQACRQVVEGAYASTRGVWLWAGGYSCTYGWLSFATARTQLGC